MGHPTRIRLLQALGEGPVAFSELKKRAGIESSGLLSFHLGKLNHLASATKEGAYALTDQGREALRMLEVTHGDGLRPSVKVWNPERRRYTAIIIVLLVVLASISTIAAYQAYGPAGLRPEPFNSLSTSTTTVSVTLISSSNAMSTVIVTGHVGLNFSGTPDSIVAWVNFTASPLTNIYPPPSEQTFAARIDSAGQYWVAIPANMDVVGVSISFRSTVPCLHQCPPILPNGPPRSNMTLVTIVGGSHPSNLTIPVWCHTSPVSHLTECSRSPPSMWSIAWSGYTSQADQTGYAVGGCSGDFFLYVGSRAPVVVQNFDCP